MTMMRGNMAKQITEAPMSNCNTKHSGKSKKGYMGGGKVKAGYMKGGMVKGYKNGGAVMAGKKPKPCKMS
jgi:hypothetical protein